MLQQCPNCRARDPGDRLCRRCGMDLAPLLATQAAAEQLMREALAQLVAGDNDAARSSLKQARALRRDRFTDLLLAFVQ